LHTRIIEEKEKSNEHLKTIEAEYEIKLKEISVLHEDEIDNL